MGSIYACLQACRHGGPPPEKYVCWCLVTLPLCLTASFPDPRRLWWPEFGWLEGTVREFSLVDRQAGSFGSGLGGVLLVVAT